MEFVKPATIDDCNYLHDWVRNSTENFLWAARSFQFPLDPSVIQNHVKGALSDEPVRVIFTAMQHQTSVGHVELERVNPWNQSAIVCRVLVNPKLRGQGIGTRMMQGLVKNAFSDLGLSRLELFVFASNLAAIQTYKKSGFIVEGHLTQWMRNDHDVFEDAKIMAVIKPTR
jgi:RimJ/RimL family protein N-acetyltransferase